VFQLAEVNDLAGGRQGAMAALFHCVKSTRSEPFTIRNG